MAIEWRDSMSVANERVDKDHQYLITLLNTMEIDLEHPENKEPILRTLLKLKKYTIEHFEREEHLQLRIRYPKLNEHRKIHQNLVKELDEIITSVNTAGPEGETKHISELLHDWLINHVLQEDLPMKPYFAKHPPDFS